MVPLVEGVPGAQDRGLYVRLKHALSELTLRATAQPTGARFVAWMAAYARLAAWGEAVPEEDVRAEAVRLARPAGWALSLSDLAPLIRVRVLWRGAGRLSAPRAYRPHWRYFRQQVDRLHRAVLFLMDPPPAPEPERSTYRGLVLFDFGLFFACHEHFEGLWRDTVGEDRDFYQGLVQLAAAFYHHEKGNSRGAVALLRRAMRRLASYRPSHQGLDVDVLLHQLGPWEARFALGARAPYPVLVSSRGLTGGG
ncbi:MAG: DUF309 domain-containing protein [Armatimonadota bacterium]|nr:DUF309 domain-containing protein [Armatimonadota bacterium]MDR7615818.1 DUF309 domain-containing protein [Armatimonadota bacterium]